MTIAILFDNGKEIRVNCSKCTVNKSLITDLIESIRFEEIKENLPMYIDYRHVIAVYRVQSDEMIADMGGEFR